MTLEALLDKAIALLANESNQELMLYFFGDCEWRAEAVNESEAVCLGEIEGKYRASGATAAEAVENLIAKIAARRKLK